LEGAALKYFDILRRRGAMLNFKEVVLRMEERFGKLPQGQLPSWNSVL
jgi:hypothetical protein